MLFGKEFKQLLVHLVKTREGAITSNFKKEHDDFITVLRQFISFNTLYGVTDNDTTKMVKITLSSIGRIHVQEKGKVVDCWHKCTQKPVNGYVNAGG